MDNIKITQAEFLKNFLRDIFIRLSDCRNDLYEDSSVLNSDENMELLKSHLRSINIRQKIYNKCLIFIKKNVNLVNNGRVLDVTIATAKQEKDKGQKSWYYDRVID